MTAAVVFEGDCLEVMRGLADCSVDSVVTDPPYELGFMGKSWDASGVAFRVEVWREALRVLKTGGHLLAFSGSRTYHRMAVAIEDAGFEIRDQIMWLYGSGFPKSHNLEGDWQGWGTALKPAHEPIVVARKPLIGTVAANVLAHGTGALNIDGCRVGTDGGTAKAGPPSFARGISLKGSSDGSLNGGGCVAINAGRWPANLIHDGSEEVVGMFPDTGPSKAAHRGSGKMETSCYGVYGGESTIRGHDDAGGSAARFFYSAKASKRDRDEGLEAMQSGELRRVNSGGLENDPRWAPVVRKNIHPTVKPTDLMRYLCRLVTPSGGMVLDPFTGSGSTGKGAVLEGFRFMGIELSPEYAEIARARIRHALGPVAPEPVELRPEAPAPLAGQLKLFA